MAGMPEQPKEASAPVTVPPIPKPGLKPRPPKAPPPAHLLAARKGFDGKWQREGDRGHDFTVSNDTVIWPNGDVRRFTNLGSGVCTLELPDQVYRGKFISTDRITWDNGSVWTRLEKASDAGASTQSSGPKEAFVAASAKASGPPGSSAWSSPATAARGSTAFDALLGSSAGATPSTGSQAAPAWSTAAAGITPGCATIPRPQRPAPPIVAYVQGGAVTAPVRPASPVWSATSAQQASSSTLQLEGAWRKVGSTSKYKIEGTKIHWLDSGSIYTVTAGSNPGVFVAHIEGSQFVAKLFDEGRKLQWNNGGTWEREAALAGVPSSATTAPAASTEAASSVEQSGGGSTPSPAKTEVSSKPTVVHGPDGEKIGKRIDELLGQMMNKVEGCERIVRPAAPPAPNVSATSSTAAVPAAPATVTTAQAVQPPAAAAAAMPMSNVWAGQQLQAAAGIQYVAALRQQQQQQQAAINYAHAQQFAQQNLLVQLRHAQTQPQMQAGWSQHAAGLQHAAMAAHAAQASRAAAGSATSAQPPLGVQAGATPATAAATTTATPPAPAAPGPPLPPANSAGAKDAAKTSPVKAAPPCSMQAGKDLRTQEALKNLSASSKSADALKKMQENDKKALEAKREKEAQLARIKKEKEEAAQKKEAEKAEAAKRKAADDAKREAEAAKKKAKAAKAKDAKKSSSRSQSRSRSRGEKKDRRNIRRVKSRSRKRGAKDKHRRRSPSSKSAKKKSRGRQPSRAKRRKQKSDSSSPTAVPDGVTRSPFVPRQLQGIFPVAGKLTPGAPVSKSAGAPPRLTEGGRSEASAAAAAEILERLTRSAADGIVATSKAKSIASTAPDAMIASQEDSDLEYSADHLMKGRWADDSDHEDDDDFAEKPSAVIDAQASERLAALSSDLLQDREEEEMEEDDDDEMEDNGPLPEVSELRARALAIGGDANDSFIVKGARVGTAPTVCEDDSRRDQPGAVEEAVQMQEANSHTQAEGQRRVRITSTRGQGVNLMAVCSFCANFGEVVAMNLEGSGSEASAVIEFRDTSAAQACLRQRQSESLHVAMA